MSGFIYTPDYILTAQKIYIIAIINEPQIHFYGKKKIKKNHSATLAFRIQMHHLVMASVIFNV